MTGERELTKRYAERAAMSVSILYLLQSNCSYGASRTHADGYGA